MRRRSTTTSTVCFWFLVSLGDGVDLVHLAVDAHAHEALRAQLDEQFELLAFAVHHRRREDHQLGFLGHHQHRVDHLRDRHRGELLLRVVGAVRLADAGVEQAQVIVDFGDGADGRARIVRRRLLLDGNRRRQAFDQVDVGLFHQLQELPRVSRQRLDVAALPFGVERVEGERALARAGEPGDDDQPVSRQIEIDVLEVVRSGAANADVFHVLPARRSGLRSLPLLACHGCTWRSPIGARWGQRRRRQPANILLSARRF